MTAARRTLAVQNARIWTTADSVERRSLRACLAWLSLAEHDFTLASAEYAEAGRADVAAALRKLAPVRYRNATAAALMSSLVPGSGEIYAGRPATGLLSLAVTG